MFVNIGDMNVNMLFCARAIVCGRGRVLIVFIGVFFVGLFLYVFVFINCVGIIGGIIFGVV